MLQRGDSVPHFSVRSVRGELVSYPAIWQRRNLVLVTIPALDSESIVQYVDRLTARTAEFGEQSTECIITRDPVEGLPCPGVLIADRWGEIAYVAAGRDVADLPDSADLIDWAEYLQRRCPECEGEAK
jgi:peroxiredoxin